MAESSAETYAPMTGTPLALLPAAGRTNTALGRWAVAIWLLTACSPEPVQPPTPIAQRDMGPVGEINTAWFATSIRCKKCHGNHDDADAMRDAKGRPVAPHDLWQATLMANSARDPLWRAFVAAETVHNPAIAEDIERECVRCHAPMAVHEARLAGQPTPTLAVVDEASAAGELARDGVSCTLCHLLPAKNLGAPETFNGHIRPNDKRLLYGPYDDADTHAMMEAVSFQPRHGPHMHDSALCAGCHTLLSESVDETGQKTGHVLPELTTWMAWANANPTPPGVAPHEMENTCQHCHVPHDSEEGIPIQTKVARLPDGGDRAPIPVREHFGRHVFLGANTLVLSMFRDARAQLRPDVPAAAFEEAIERTRAFLFKESATLQTTAKASAPGGLEVEVKIENLTGHKLPGGHPTRRMWLRLRALDKNGTVRWRSGGYDSAGRILNGAGEVLPMEKIGGPLAKHRQVVDSQDQVQVYEVALADHKGERTFSLKRAASRLKDNRIMPPGWRPEGPWAKEIAPVGVAGDGGFVGGGHTVRYLVPKSAGAIAKVQVDLVLQPLGARQAAELLKVDHEDVRRFAALWERADRWPEVLATDKVAIP